MSGTNTNRANTFGAGVVVAGAERMVMACEPQVSPPRIGELLVKRGALTAAQVETVLRAQRSRREPFGLLAEEMFDVPKEVLEEAWAEQYSYITAKVDPQVERIDALVVRTLSARQAWQFRMLPMRYDGREVMIVTSQQHLAKALRFAYQHFGPSCYFVLTDDDKLREALDRHYPMLGDVRDNPLLEQAVA